MFAVHVSLLITPGAEAEFLAAIGENAAAALRDEPGCLRFDVVRDAADPERFWLDEHYADAEAFAAHRATPHFGRWRGVAADLLRVDGQTVHTGEIVLAPRADDTAVVTRATAAVVVDRGAGVRTIHLTARDSGPVRFLNGITEFAENADLPLHWHNCEESVVVIDGLATVEAGEDRHTLRPGDAVRVPAGLPHRFLNRGPERLRILWTYGRADATRTLAATGETFRVGEEPAQPA